jgi:hypothetical protein
MQKKKKKKRYKRGKACADKKSGETTGSSRKKMKSCQKLTTILTIELNLHTSPKLSLAF